jgi:AraC-like DNA-binding protein
MRQIVRKKRQIVQTDTVRARLLAITNGHADAASWDGKTTWFEWSLDRAIGYLLPTDTPLEASCSAGVVNRICPGEMLIINRGNDDTFRLQLQTGASNGSTQTVHAVLGHMRMKSSSDTFADVPSRAMTVVKLTSREENRVTTLSRLVAAERRQDDAAPRALTTYLEKALYESLAEVLCTCDPLGLPEFAAMADTRIALALRAMTAEPALPWRVETLAREAALSRTLFATRFKLMLGTTPLEYLTALRVQLAATLREESPQRSQHDIARAVGYADESALRRAQRRMGA